MAFSNIGKVCFKGSLANMLLKHSTTEARRQLFRSMHNFSKNLSSSHFSAFQQSHHQNANRLLKNMCSLLSDKQKAFLLTEARMFSTTSRLLSRLGSTTKMSHRDKTVVIYILAAFIFMIGGAYAGVPLYKVFCQVGASFLQYDEEKILLYLELKIITCKSYLKI